MPGVISEAVLQNFSSLTAYDGNRGETCRADGDVSEHQLATPRLGEYKRELSLFLVYYYQLSLLQVNIRNEREGSREADSGSPIFTIRKQERSASLPSTAAETLQLPSDLICNKKMRATLLKANIDPTSQEGRSEIYCRFVLEYPKVACRYL